MAPGHRDGASDDARPGFPNTDRFELVTELGQGGMGVVYEVEDRDRKLRLALKSARKIDADATLRLKTEFRALRDVRHANVVQLGELFEHEGRWFFTMELVDGVDLISWTRPDAARKQERTAAETVVSGGGLAASTKTLSGPAAESSEETQAEGVAAGLASAGATRRRSAPRIDRGQPAFDEDRLRAAMRGLVCGVAALHRAGVIHRDIKPSNILVEPNGRVVLIDFGVVAELAQSDGGKTGSVVGTIAYMSPEQAAGGDVTRASDWYAVGVVLFEALTGSVPFAGKDALFTKRTLDPPSPVDLVDGLPPDLVRLCERMIQRDPAERPSSVEILAQLGVRDADVRPVGGELSVSFVGRHAELARLDAALRSVIADGAARCVVVSGESGIGKTALVRQWLEAAAADNPLMLALTSRCDEREVVPYNAFDGAIDALARELRAAPVTTSVGVQELLRLFPVLQGVDRLASHRRGPARASTVDDPRSLAFAALADLLDEVGRARPVVLVIDDAHWADIDSLALLAELFGRTDSPPVLVVMTARETAESALPARGVITIPTDTLSLTGLAADEVAALVRTVARGHAPEDRGALAVEDDVVARLGAESAGHPLFLAELARHLDRAHGHDLDAALWARIEELPGPARVLVETVTLAGAALPLGIIGEAALLAPEALARHLAALRAMRLVRVTGTREADAIEPYHDRIRETVARRLEPARRRAVHGALVAALERRGAAAELVAHHAIEAGDRVRGAALAEVAARRAALSYAFERAAAWLGVTLELGDHSPDRRRALLIERGDLLARAGHTATAAEAFLEAASPDISLDDRLELRRRACEQLLIGGHLERGQELARELLATVGPTLPTTIAGAIASVLWSRFALATSRLRWRPRPPHEVSARERLRVDVSWSIGSGLAFVESTRAGALVLETPRVALRTGDPMRIARATCAAAVASSAMGARRGALRLAATAHRAAGIEPAARLYARLADVAVTFFLDNDWLRAIALCEQAAALVDEDRVGQTFEAGFIAQHRLWALFGLVELGELRRRVPAAIRSARRVGNRFLEIGYRTFFAVTHLIDDRPDDATADVTDALAAWPVSGKELTNPQFFALKARTLIAIYRGALDDETLDADWHAASKSLLFQVPMIQLETVQYRGCLAVARAHRAREAGDGAALRRQLAVIARLLRHARKLPLPAAGPFAGQLEASIAQLRGDSGAAAAMLETVIAELDARGIRGTAACMRWRLGELRGDAGLMAAARAFFDEAGVVRPDRIVATFAPGW